VNELFYATRQESFNDEAFRQSHVLLYVYRQTLLVNTNCEHSSKTTGWPKKQDIAESSIYHITSLLMRLFFFR